MKRATVTLVMFLSFFGLGLSLIGEFGTECKSDNECKPPSLICGANKRCHQKGLASPPVLPLDIIGLLLIICLSCGGVLVGIGGGVLVNPISIALMGISQKEGIALANGIGVFVSMAKIVSVIPLKDDTKPYKTLINYDLMYLMLPCFLLGSFIAALITPIVPDIIILVVFISLLIWSMYEGIQKFKNNRKKEAQAALKEKESKASEMPGAVERNQRIESEALKTDPNLPAETTRGMIQDQNEPGKSQTIHGNDKKKATRQISREERRKDKKIKLIKKEEGSHITWTKFILLGIQFIISNLLTFLRGGLVGIVRCSVRDWYIVICFLLACSFFIVLAWKHNRNKLDQMREVNMDMTGEINWNTGELASNLFLATLVGFFSSLSGIGGAAITTFLMSLNFPQKVASANSFYIALLSKFVVTLVNYLAGTLPLDYYLAMGIPSFVLCYLVDRWNTGFDRKSRQNAI